MYRSTGYIHRKKTRPHNLISLTRWTIKWIIMSKNDGEKYISNWQRKIQLLRVNDFATDNIKHKRVMATLTLLGKILQIAIDNSCCIKTWQSWDFKPNNFISLRATRLLIFKKYHCGNLTLRRHWQKLFFFVVDIVWHAGGRYVH